MVTVLDLAPQATRNPGTVVSALTNKRAMLLMWNSHLYVLYGALYDEAQYADGSLADSINQLFLLDPALLRFPARSVIHTRKGRLESSRRLASS